LRCVAGLAIVATRQHTPHIFIVMWTPPHMSECVLVGSCVCALLRLLCLSIFGSFAWTKRVTPKGNSPQNHVYQIIVVADAQCFVVMKVFDTCTAVSMHVIYTACHPPQAVDMQSVPPAHILYSGVSYFSMSCPIKYICTPAYFIFGVSYFIFWRFIFFLALHKIYLPPPYFSNPPFIFFVFLHHIFCSRGGKQSGLKLFFGVFLGCALSFSLENWVHINIFLFFLAIFFAPWGAENMAVLGAAGEPQRARGSQEEESGGRARRSQGSQE
jgi:hypothetical protein